MKEELIKLHEEYLEAYKAYVQKIYESGQECYYTYTSTASTDKWEQPYQEFMEYVRYVRDDESALDNLKLILPQYVKRLSVIDIIKIWMS